MNISSQLSSWSELIDHSFNFSNGWSRSFRPKEFKSIDVFCSVGFLSGFYDHSTFHPHLDPLLDGQIGAFRNK